ncbi:hypothetical protein BDW72DRAFT_198064 [Aspergillus terricola var. indicus]
MLRTYYGNGEECGRKSTEYAQVSETYHAVVDCLTLSDAKVFNFGSDWRRVIEILPEVAGYDDYVNLEDEIQNSKAEYPDWKDDPDILLGPGDTAVWLSLQTTTILWIIIVDEKAFNIDELLIIYLDMYRDVTVEGRLERDQCYIDWMFMRWEDGGRQLGFVMENGTVGADDAKSSEGEG